MNAIIGAALAGAAQAAARVRRREIEVLALVVMIGTSAAAQEDALRVPVDAAESRADSEVRVVSGTIVGFATSVRRSRRHRAYPW